eukprot:3190192-Pleurochrysis_carterae.AAC.1
MPGWSQLWARPSHPQLLKRLLLHGTPAPAPPCTHTSFASAGRRQRGHGRRREGVGWLHRRGKERGSHHGRLRQRQPVLAHPAGVRGLDGDRLEHSPDQVAELTQ